MVEVLVVEGVVNFVGGFCVDVGEFFLEEVGYGV